ncbi:guanylate kinase [Rhabdochromatium marinum]|uniref:guanylate kinase n=1 Tax=Rhabdochromatium marinum TaxID=48729 RepID=UPI001904E723|nr:guanylate kinase [Rhabdochromatium marinum]MBK1650074.1 guanylate kinase [Rhabdochromatium marinum]
MSQSPARDADAESNHLQNHPDPDPAHDHDQGSGTLFVVSAPSGAGKTSLVRALLDGHPRLRLSTSYTTRAPREGEIDGVHYHFVSREAFERMIEENAFVEYAQVFQNAYGTARETLRQSLDAGQDLLLEIDWQGARQVRAHFPEAVSIFILPPSLQELERRLRERGQDSEETIAARMAEARSELSHFGEYDYLIVNDRFEAALAELRALVCAFGLRRQSQQHKLGSAIDALLEGTDA